ncbi:serine-protein kinase ATM-like, partial [Saccostrea cucullata]|uniref:serine-protein kinase ATM-like n=1 Tax=Saccostrea cuccullata TaxID=36930 RepID=UPI002ED1AD3B
MASEILVDGARNCEMALQKLAEIQGYENCCSYIETYLPYLIHQWLCLQYNVDDFPFLLVNCGSKKDFYREHFEILITELLMFKDIDNAKRVAMTLGQDWLEVLKLCIPRIVVFILPQFAASQRGETASEHVKKRTAHATACYTLLTDQAGKEMVDKCIGNNLDVIVVNILLCLYDLEDDKFMKTAVI